MSEASKRQVGGSHYKDAGIQPWDVIDTWPIEQQIGAYRAGALKYIMRMGTKDEAAQEIRKAAHYCEKLAETLEKNRSVSNMLMKAPLDPKLDLSKIGPGAVYEVARGS